MLGNPFGEHRFDLLNTIAEVREDRNVGIDMVPAIGMPFREERLGPAEHERDEVTDRDRTRRIVYKAVDIALDAVLNTPGDRILDPARLWQESTPSAVTAMREYRARARSRLMHGAASAPDEPTDPAELTCQDP